MKVFNKRKQLKFRRYFSEVPLGNSCQVFALMFALRLTFHEALCMLSEYGWSAQEPAAQCFERILGQHGWSGVRLAPSKRRALRYFAVSGAVVGLSEHVLWVEDGTAHDVDDNRDELVEEFWVPPSSRKTSITKLV